MKRILLLFIDGLGVAPSGPGNPITADKHPTLYRILAEATPIDASLDHPGLPQSATGQATMLTGINAAKALGRHVEGFPGPELQKIVSKHNIFRRLAEHGRRATFANAYTKGSIQEVREHRFRSVTTTCALSSPQTLRLFPRILNNRAIYQDVTRHSLVERGLDITTVTPEEAAQHLLQISAHHDLTLFEYFQTDRAGHRGTLDRVRPVLSILDAFCAAIIAGLDDHAVTLALTSDHGNIEDLTTRSHTHNPVPWFVTGKRAAELKNVSSLLDVTPALLSAIC